jgi:hypothetical protein
MKLNRSLLLATGLLIVLGCISRVAGFAPQIAMAVFGAAVIRDKRLAIALPLFSMFLSDVVIELLYQNGYMAYQGFYAGQSIFDSQVLNYILLAALGVFGLWARNLKPSRIIIATLAAPVAYFLLSNAMVWLGGGGFSRPLSFSGLMLCYSDALPFFRSSLLTTAAFSAIFFTSYFSLHKLVLQKQPA